MMTLKKFQNRIVYRMMEKREDDLWIIEYITTGMNDELADGDDPVFQNSGSSLLLFFFSPEFDPAVFEFWSDDSFYFRRMIPLLVIPFYSSLPLLWVKSNFGERGVRKVPSPAASHADDQYTRSVLFSASSPFVLLFSIFRKIQWEKGRKACPALSESLSRNTLCSSFSLIVTNSGFPYTFILCDQQHQRHKR